MVLASTRLGDFPMHNYAVLASCEGCHSERRISAAFLIKMLGEEYRMDRAGQDRLRRRMVCHVCRRREPHLLIGRV